MITSRNSWRRLCQAPGDLAVTSLLSEICSDRVLTVEGSRRRWAHPGAPWRGHGRCYGDLSSGLRAKFFSLWWSLRRWLLSFPPNACRGERCGVWGRRAPSDGVGVFFWSVSSSSSGRVSPRAICYPQAHPQGLGACIMTYSAREEERAPSIYRSSCFDRAQRPCRGCAVPKDFLI